MEALNKVVVIFEENGIEGITTKALSSIRIVKKGRWVPFTTEQVGRIIAGLRLLNVSLVDAIKVRKRSERFLHIRNAERSDPQNCQGGRRTQDFLRRFTSPELEECQR